MDSGLLYKLEQRNPGLLFTDSDGKGMAYVTSSEDNRIGVIIGENHQVAQMMFLTKKQAEVLARELPDMLMFVGRGRKIRGDRDAV